MHRLGFIFCQIILGNIDAFIAPVQFFGEKFLVNVMGLTSDRRASAKPLHAMFWILAIYNPECDGTCLVIAGAQLFGCSATPLNLYRIPN